jgi:hypothetical protein
VIVAPVGIASTAVLREFARVIEVSALAVPTASFDRQKTSGAVSAVLMPQAPTVPTMGAGTPGPQSYPSVLPTRTKSPCWFT